MFILIKGQILIVLHIIKLKSKEQLKAQLNTIYLFIKALITHHIIGHHHIYINRLYTVIVSQILVDLMWQDILLWFQIIKLNIYHP